MIKYHVYFSAICLLIFIGQTYVFATRTVEAYLVPFTESQSVYVLVHDALWSIWSGMLIWPALLFVVLITSIIEVNRKDVD